MNLRRIVIGISIFLLLVSISLLYTWMHIPRLAYINANEVYNDFELKKELERKLEGSQNLQKRMLDSLYTEVEVLGQSIRDHKDNSKTSLFQKKKQQYLAKNKEFTQANQEVTNRYSEQIWKQLNQYIDDYGSKYDYSFIIGASGNGSLMHGDINYNITDKVKAYVNQRYKGAIE